MGISKQERNRQIARSYVEYYEELQRLGEKQRVSWDLAADQVQEFYLHWLQMPVSSASQPRKKKAKPWARRSVWLAGLTHRQRRAARQATEETYEKSRQTAAGRKWAERHKVLDELVEKEEREKKEMASGLDATIRRILKKHATERMQLIYSMRSTGERTLKQIGTKLGVCERVVRLDMEKVRAILQVELPQFGWSLPS